MITDDMVDAAKEAYDDVYEAEFILGEPRLTDNASFAMRAALEAVAPMLAPDDPSGAMLVAARDWSYEKYGKPIGDYAAKGCWKAMLAAAPSAASKPK